MVLRCFLRRRCYGERLVSPCESQVWFSFRQLHGNQPDRPLPLGGCSSSSVQRGTKPRMMEFWARPEGIPRCPGAYVLAIELSRPIALALANKSPVSLAAGCYLYCGSAKGPGGLRARIERHMRRGKPVRWHIDNLTEAGRVLGVWTIVGGHECQLAASLTHLPIPIDGFGSSDCRRCTSHLVRWPGQSTALLRNGIGSVLTKPTRSAASSNARRRARDKRFKPSPTQ
jgi:Uri superfamily endonuclease